MIRKGRLSVHPLFLLLFIYGTIQGKLGAMLMSLCSVLLHEYAHYLAAYNKGYVLDKVRLMPYGAMLSGKGALRGKDNVAVALAGPCSNLLLALLLAGVWWLFPPVYYYTDTLFLINILLAGFNLLPAFPLDASRIVVALSRNKLRAVKWTKGVGVVLAAVSMTVCFISLFYSFNLNYGIIAVFLLAGSLGSDNVDYLHLADGTLQAKRMEYGVTVRLLVISPQATLLRILKCISPSYLTVFRVLSADGEVIAVLTEEELIPILLNNKMSCTIAQALNKKA